MRRSFFLAVFLLPGLLAWASRAAAYDAEKCKGDVTCDDPGGPCYLKGKCPKPDEGGVDCKENPEDPACIKKKYPYDPTNDKKKPPPGTPSAAHPPGGPSGAGNPGAAPGGPGATPTGTAGTPGSVGGLPTPGGGGGGGGGGGQGGGGEGGGAAQSWLGGSPGSDAKAAEAAAAAKSLEGSAFGSGNAGKNALDRAAGIGANMKASMSPTEDSLGGMGKAGGGGGGAGKAAAGGGGGGPTGGLQAGKAALERGSEGKGPGLGDIKPPPDFTTPKTDQDLALAAMSGFGGSFSEMGLKVGRGPGGGTAILRNDGSPASQSEIQTLAAHISKEPLALMQRPDFYQVLPREKFNTLKQDYRSRPELADDEFRHITMSESERDFQRSQSCQRLSGSCNKYTKTMSYRRGDYVPPEDLNAIWDKIKAEAAADTASQGQDLGSPGAAKLKQSAGIGAKLAASMKSLFGGMESFFGGGPPSAAGKAIPASAQTAPAAPSGGYAYSSGPAAPLDLAAPRRDTLRTFALPKAEAADPLPPPRTGLGKLIVIAFAAATAAGGLTFFLLLLRRRKKEEPAAPGPEEEGR